MMLVCHHSCSRKYWFKRGGAEAKHTVYCQWNYIVYFGEGLTNSAIQTLRLKGEVHILLICLLGHPFFINTVQGTGTANAYASELQIMEL
jgi:hypothetical protein